MDQLGGQGYVVCTAGDMCTMLYGHAIMLDGALENGTVSCRT